MQVKKFSLVSASILGSLIAVFTLVTSIIGMPDYSTWLSVYHAMIISSILVCGVVGFKSRTFRESLLAGGKFMLVFMSLYLAGYLFATIVLRDYLSWIPFSYKDYTYYGYTSVRSYLDANAWELIRLQLSAMLIASFFYMVFNLFGFLLRPVKRRSI
jgi:hypothetical protein